MTSGLVMQEEVRKGEGYCFHLGPRSDIPTVELGGSAFFGGLVFHVFPGARVDLREARGWSPRRIVGPGRQLSGGP